MKTIGTFLVIFFLVMITTSASAVTTEITVHVKTKDAKFLGTSMGGALVTIKDAQTGELLAKGVTRGGTGNTALIMMTPLTRGRPITDESAAGFTVSINIDSPSLLEVTAYGPLVNLQAANKASATQWVVPGKHITGGDAWVIEIPGFVVDVLEPPTHVNLSGTPQSVDIRANVTMM
jgi:hypothetical protein